MKRQKPRKHGQNRDVDAGKRSAWCCNAALGGAAVTVDLPGGNIFPTPIDMLARGTASRKSGHNQALLKCCLMSPKPRAAPGAVCLKMAFVRGMAVHGDYSGSKQEKYNKGPSPLSGLCQGIRVVKREMNI